MPTNEERREIAARLRENCYFADFALDCLLRADVDDKKYSCNDCEACRNITINRLADLIEPEPERTCADVGKPAYFKCSECRWISVVFSSSKGLPVYCPCCGAKVVE